jgi:hypothetical protein
MMMGVADMPIQTLKLLNIHPDTRSSKKGKERAKNADGTPNGESSRSGRPNPERTTTGTTQASGISGDSTPPALQSPGLAKSGSEIQGTVHSNIPGSPSHRSAFMSEAFAASAQRSPSRERVRQLSQDCSSVLDRRNPDDHKKSETSTPQRTETGSSSSFADNLRNMQTESAVDTGKGLARIVGAGFKSPMDFSLNVAKGFHNVPKLYGGEVRQVEKVTDLKSGLSTAAKVSPLPMLRCPT